MRQGIEVIDKALREGLRRFSNNPRNMPGLVECFNLAPAEQGLEVHETIIDLGAPGITWVGEGQYTASAITRTITIRVTDYVSDAELQTVTVFIDGVDKGTNISTE